MKRKHQSQFSYSTLLRLLCAALLISISFAHRPVSAQPPASFEHMGEENRLPDGSFADICRELHADESEEHPHSALYTICEACILTSTFLLPDSIDANIKAPNRASLANPWTVLTNSHITCHIERYFARGPPKLIYLKQ